VTAALVRWLVGSPVNETASMASKQAQPPLLNGSDGGDLDASVHRRSIPGIFLQAYRMNEFLHHGDWFNLNAN